jgi:hypothetical protein
MQLAIGMGVASCVAADALIDIDFDHARYGFAGHYHAARAAFLAAAGGVASGSAMALGPVIVGPDLIADGSFSGGTLDGWASGTSYVGNGSLSIVDERLVYSINSPTGAYRASRPNTVTAGRAYRFAGTLVSKSPTPPLTTVNISGASNIDLGNSDSRGADLSSSGTFPQALQTVAGTSQSTLYTGFATISTVNTAVTATFDDVSLHEVRPYAGYVPGGFSFRLAATTPAAASGNKVALQWGTDGERYRVRLVWDASKHLRLIVTTAGTEQANLDLGTVDTSTQFELEASIGANRISARLDGGDELLDTSATVPSVGLFWIGRSHTGENWDGTFHHLAVWSSAKS